MCQLRAGDRDRCAADEGDTHFIGPELLLTRVVHVGAREVWRGPVIRWKRDPAARHAAVRILRMVLSAACAGDRVPVDKAAAPDSPAVLSASRRLIVSRPVRPRHSDCVRLSVPCHVSLWLCSLGSNSVFDVSRLKGRVEADLSTRAVSSSRATWKHVGHLGAALATSEMAPDSRRTRCAAKVDC